MNDLFFVAEQVSRAQEVNDLPAAADPVRTSATGTRLESVPEVRGIAAEIDQLSCGKSGYGGDGF
jgi:hypothetical protein